MKTPQIPSASNNPHGAQLPDPERVQVFVTVADRFVHTAKVVFNDKRRRFIDGETSCGQRIIAHSTRSQAGLLADGCPTCFPKHADVSGSIEGRGFRFRCSCGFETLTWSAWQIHNGKVS